MQTDICKRLGIDYPIFAFSHCRDVVVEVSKAGGIGVLGAVGYTVAQLREELDWIDAHIGDKPYGVDVVIPQKYEGMGDMDPAHLEQALKKQIPQAHRDFAARLLREAGVPELANDDARELLGWTEATALPLVHEALTRPRCKLIANALGTPPADTIKLIQDSGRLVGALCGRVKQAIAHKAAGLDFIVAQGGEGGGHSGDVGSIVLWPQIIDAVGDTPVLAAGGIGSGRQMAAAIAMGAQGVWSGSIWLGVEEAHGEPAQKASYYHASSEDTVRSRSFTGKPCRMLKNDWTEAWAAEGNPKPLAMPLQGMVTFNAIARTAQYAGVNDCQKVAFNPVGQVVGQMQGPQSCRDVVFELLSGFIDASDRLQQLLPQD